MCSSHRACISQACVFDKRAGLIGYASHRVSDLENFFGVFGKSSLYPSVYQLQLIEYASRLGLRIWLAREPQSTRIYLAAARNTAGNSTEPDVSSYSSAVARLALVLASSPRTLICRLVMHHYCHRDSTLPTPALQNTSCNFFTACVPCCRRSSV